MHMPARVVLSSLSPVSDEFEALKPRRLGYGLVSCAARALPSKEDGELEMVVRLGFMEKKTNRD
jgi:hypothetical protein